MITSQHLACFVTPMLLCVMCCIRSLHPDSPGLACGMLCSRVAGVAGHSQ